MDNQVKKISAWLGTGSINIFGRPFAGKDTQGRILADVFNGVLVAGGDILRSYHDQGKIKQLMSTGELFPTDFYLSIVLPFLSQPEFKKKPLILSSVGRLHGEEPAILEATSSSNHPIKAVILLQLSKEEVWRRYGQAMIQQDRGERADDRREALKTRLDKFQDKTIPVIEFYQARNLLITVDGNKPREEVTNEILKSLANRVST